ncbi:MAG: 3-dehydroquinate synthase [Oscillospiraceae bacterium]|nr:3-dehydroquinate synthase [Oscillospiraceae bacterium]
MNTIHVPVRDAYNVFIERGILSNCGALIEDLISGRTCAIITDDNVDKLYADALTASLEGAGLQVVKFVIPHGEASKCNSSLMQIYSFLCENDITRADCLIALGGGVVGDLTGFAAATYLRGIHYIQVPTSLLAQVDSSVGGKTAIDLPEGKNLVGAFYQPDAVFCDPDTLRTLPREFLTDGMGEVVKYGMIADPKLFDLLCECDLDTVQEHFDEIIPACVSVKRDVVAEDERDTGLRMILNFGHTIGHAIEAYYHYETYTHGCAVGAGMCLMTKYNGSAEDYARLVECCERYGLPTDVEAPLSKLLPLCSHDKKRLGGTIRYITCSPIGTAHIKTAPYHDFCRLFER